MSGSVSEENTSGRTWPDLIVDLKNLFVLACATVLFLRGMVDEETWRWAVGFCVGGDVAISSVKEFKTKRTVIRHGG